MRKTLQLQVSPSVAATPSLLEPEVRAQLGLNPHDRLQIRLLKRSIDARGRKIRINLTLEAGINEALDPVEIDFTFRDVAKSKRTCHIIGAGPAGLFAALKCIEEGVKPIIIERGKDVKSRRRDLAAITRNHIVNPESNYCFGEGGAGTYSDGKLYTRSGKRGDIERVLKMLVYHGAGQEILIDAHPHIGTNKLPQLIENIRNTILKYGGELRFNCKLEDFIVSEGFVKTVTIKDAEGREEIEIQKLVLATGHSARDIYSLLNNKGLLLEAKPFAAGVRVEHPQDLIDSIQYHCASNSEVHEVREFLPAASYSLVHQVKDRGVYSFCMCPGGIIAPCATAQEEVVTNGWSPSKRNNPYANSGIVVALGLNDFEHFKKHGPLSGLEFQKDLEGRAWEYGGKTQVAPAQRLMDFLKGKPSTSLPDCSYTPGVKSADMMRVLNPLIANALREGFKGFGGKMRGYLTNEALIVGVESRTSTPVRIPRDKDGLHHPQVKNLFPCGEGAGFAGGIVSAAMDGERCASVAVV
jgi:uncharacterized FAD-dependent dehydrogenase